MSEENKTVVKRFITEYIDGRDERVCDELIAEDFVNHSGLPGLPEGKAGIKPLFNLYHSAFAGLHTEIYDLAAEGDKVWTRKSLHGTHAGEFMGIPATGKKVRIDIMDVLRLRRGKIVEHWNVVDQAGLMRQLQG